MGTKDRELSRLVMILKTKLARLKNLVNWLRISDYACGSEAYLSYDFDSMIEQAELIISHAEKVAAGDPNDQKTDHDIDVQILAIRRFSPQLTDCYDELEYFHLLRQEAIEGNPFVEEPADFKNRCEPAWFDEMACDNGIHSRDDTN